MTAEHSLHSSLREKIIEHLFIGEVLKSLWCKDIRDVDVLKPEVDNSGYDVVVSCQGITRFIQLKASFAGSSTSQQKVNLALGRKVGGCVLWIYFDPTTLNLGPYLWFGGTPGNPLPNIEGFPVAKHTKGNKDGVKKERMDIRVLNKGKFVKLNDLDDVLRELFGV